MAMSPGRPKLRPAVARHLTIPLSAQESQQLDAIIKHEIFNRDGFVGATDVVRALIQQRFQEVRA